MYAPKFTITSSINNKIAKIEAIRQKISYAKILPAQEITLRYKAAVESAHSSTSIEGNPLNPKQVRNALEGKMNAWEKRVIEVVNYKNAWDWIAKRSKRKSAITIEDIFYIHSLVMKDILPLNKLGRIRPSSIYVVDIVKGQDVVRYTGPNQKIVQGLLTDLLSWLNSNSDLIHPILLTGILHYEFVSIHPFSDGNGRVTRLLVKLLLDLLGYDFKGSLVLDTYYLQNTGKYYESLNQANKHKLQTKSDLTPWLTYFIDGFYLVSKELERKISLIRSSKNDDSYRLTENEIEILDYVHQFGEINLQGTVSFLRIPARTIQRLLQNLVKKKILIKIGRGKNTSYNLCEII